jgi:hypothetical protein
MDDAGAHAVPLKAALLAGHSTVAAAAAAAIGTRLGKFLRALHDQGRADRSLPGAFEGWTFAREVAAFITYGRLGDTLRTPGRAATIRGAADADGGGGGGGGGDVGMTDDDQLVSVLGDEPLGVSEDTLRVVEALAELRMAQIRRESCDDDTLVMGDFWPGNILVCDSGDKENSAVDGGRLMVVDWEIARPGLAGMDVGQFCAELATVRQLRPERAEAAGEILKHFVRAYFAGEVGSSEVEETRRVALGQFGVHLAVWTPRTGWNAGAEATRKVVLNGVERLVQGADAQRIWTDEELVQIFMC